MLTIGGNQDCTGNADPAVTVTGDLIGQIQRAALNAHIVHMGYPRIVSDQPCVTADFDTLNYLADYIRDKQKAQVDELKRSGTKVAFADPVPTFKGHGICDSNEKPGTNTCLSLESFHPKNDGTTGYAKVTDQELADIGYKGD